MLGYWHKTMLPKSCPSAPADHLCSFLQLILWIYLHTQVFSPHISPLALAAHYEMLLPVSQISCGAGDSWLTPNARKGLSCIQSREKIGAREMFIILVPTERSNIYFVSDLWLCQPLQTHGRACLPTVSMESS